MKPLATCLATFLFAASLVLGQTTEPTTRPSTVGTIAPAAKDVNPLSIGGRVPAIFLKSVDGSSFDLNAEMGKKPTVLIFYRGGWCPFCNRQMGGLEGIVNDLRDLGYQLLAISPDRPEELAKSVAKHSLTYTLLSDSDAKAIQAFGLAFRVSDATYAHMLTLGADLEKASGEKHHALPVPAVYIVGTDCVIRFVHYDPNFRQRMEPQEILKQAKLALSSPSPAAAN